MAAIAPVRRGNTQRRPFSQRGVRRPPERIAFRRPCIVFAPLVIDEFVQRVRVGLVVHVVHHIGIVARFRRIGAVLR